MVYTLENEIQDIANEIPIKEGNYFITGATGFIGSYIALCLLHLCKNKNKKITVILSVRNLKKAQQIYSEYIDKNYLKIYVNDMTENHNITENVDYIIHVAAKKYAGNNGAYDVFSENILSMKSIISLATKKSIKKIIYVSTCSVYGNMLYLGNTDESFAGSNVSMNPKACYSESKRASEYMFASALEQYSLTGNVVRLFSVYGIGMNIDNNTAFSSLFSQCISKDVIEISGTGEDIRNFSYIGDVIFGIFTVLYGGEEKMVYNVGSKNGNCSIYELAKKMLKISGREITIHISKKGKTKPTNQAASLERIEKICKQPDTSIEEGLMKMFAYYRGENESFK